MRLTTGVTILSATTLCCCVTLGLASESSYEDALRPRLLSRRAIDGTRGRVHFNPQEDNFFDDYGYDKGQYHGAKKSSAYEDLKSNVPGEPGVDYPAFVRIPRTTFSCIDRERGYYADEEAGCQVFHVCDEGLVSSFLCPVGSLFSQRLLTCDWWSKVPCAQSHEFYSLQSHADDASLTEHMLRHASTAKDRRDQDENQEHLDQEKEQNQVEVQVKSKEAPILVTMKKNENQLDQGHKHRVAGHVRGQVHHRNPVLQVQDKDSPVIRIKPLVGENRPTRVRGHSRSNVNHHRRGHHEASSTKLPSTTTTTINPIDEPSIFSSALPVQDGHSSVSTATPQETTYEQHQDTSSENVPIDAPTKKGLKEGDTTNFTDFDNHNSAYEYYDMEGKESIGLASSHAERNFEKEEEKAATTENSDSEMTTLEPLAGTTPASAETVESTTQLEESIQAKESINLVHSKVHEKLQLYDQEKVTVSDNLQNSTEPKSNTEETVNLVVDDVAATTPQYEAEASATSINSAETSTDTSYTNTYTFPITASPEASSTKRVQEVRKMSGFRINVAEKRTMQVTTLPSDEISASDYQELLNSSDTSFTTTFSPITVTTEELTTMMSNNVRRISDTVEESNAPYEVTLMLNGSNEYPVSNDQSPIGASLLGQLISQHENQPIDLTNLEIVRSDQANQEYSPTQNQQQVSTSVPVVRTYQNFRNYQAEQRNQQNYRNYEPQPVIATTFRNYDATQVQFVPTTTEVPQLNYENYQYHQDESSNSKNYETQDFRKQPFVSTTTEVPQQNYRNFQNPENGPTNLKNYEFHQEEPQDFSNQQLVPSTTAAPQQTYRNYQSRQNEQRSFRNNQAHRDERRNFRRPVTQNFVSTTRSYFPDPEKPLNIGPLPVIPSNVKNYHNQPEEPRNFDTYRLQPEVPNNVQTYQNEPETPSNFRIDQNRPKEPKRFNNFNSQRNEPENLRNNYHVNYQTHHYPENVPDYQQNQQKNVESPTRNYDYQTYQSTEIPQNYQNQHQNIDNSQNYVNQQNTKNFHSTRNRPTSANSQNYESQKNVNAPDYQNYDSADDMLESTNFGDFGVRISAKNPSANILKVHTKPTKMVEDTTDAHIINSGLQGKAANFLWAMSQLAKNDRLPRPFTQNQNKVDQSFSRQRNTHQRNNFANDYNQPRQNGDNFNNLKPVSNNVNNYNNYNSFSQNKTHVIDQGNVDYNANFNGNPVQQNVPQNQYNVNVDDFAAPIYENPQPNFGHNFTEPREERILNYDPALPVPESPVQILQNTQQQFNSYSVQSTPEVNTVPFDRNSQFVQVSPPNLSQYNEGSTLIPSSNAQILRQPEPLPIDYSSFQQSPHLPTRNNPQPQSVDFTYQQSTEQIIEDDRVPHGNVEVTKYFTYQKTTQQTIDDDVRVPHRTVDVLPDVSAPSIDYDFRPTVGPSNDDRRYTDTNTTQEANVNTSVETEFIPSLSFDFGSDEGRKEYLEALEKGLVSNDSGSRRIDEDLIRSAASATVETKETEATNRSEKSEKSEKSDSMDNFKDSGSVMSATE